MATVHLNEIVQSYSIGAIPFSPVELSILRRASQLLGRCLDRQKLKSPQEVQSYLQCKLAGLEFEVFGALWLDAQFCLLADEVLFRGSISQTAVYPREVVKHALRLNASAVILYHNHPSMSPEPSQADQSLTGRLSQALDLVGVRVSDHFVVSGNGEIVSFAQRGLI